MEADRVNLIRLFHFPGVVILFVLAISPILFVMLVWVVVSAYRILHPDEPRERYRDPGYFDFPLDPVREPVLMGAQTIREEGRRKTRGDSLSSPYDFLDGHSDGFPELWWEDVLRRRN